MESEEEGRMEKRKVLRLRSVDKGKQEKIEKRTLVNNLTKLLKKSNENLSASDRNFLEENDELVETIKGRMSDKVAREDRKKEWEDDIKTLRDKCSKLAEAIKKSKRLVVYTGAGISTSANIPDYRGPQGVWTLLDQGKEVQACDLGLAQPTTAHMALFMLYKQGKISHIVSQNCDGLHLRSGIPRSKLSEVHGNMFIEVCKICKPVRPFVRLFDVTERTNRYRHGTRRRCYICGSGLVDTIVHFGERGSIAWPINWNGASRAAEKADMILCLGSSLKVLRRYPWLWCMDRPVKQRPPLYIVNLQWTPKDAAATLKLNGRCDFVMAQVLKHLRMKLPEYTPYNDPLLSYATHLHEKEEHTTSRKTLIESRPVGVTQLSMEASVSPTGVITEVRVSNKFTTAKSEFSYMSSERQSCSRTASPPHSRTVSQLTSPSPYTKKSQTVVKNGYSNGQQTEKGEDRGSKKAKIESPLDSDCDSDDFSKDLDNLSHLLGGPQNSPFPSPDHNYAISPVKTETEIKSETENIVKDVKVEPKEEEDETPSRYRLRQQKKCRYNELDEEYFLMCQEELLKSAKRDHKKRLENKIKKAIEDNEEFKELEYRTIEWAKDALYFSYEPSFLFVDEDDEEVEEEFVCECCDPKKKKKHVSSEEVSDLDEENQAEEDPDQDDLDELLTDTDEEAEDSPFRSRENSPVPGSLPATSLTPAPSKPLAPGWFGKGRRKRVKMK